MTDEKGAREILVDQRKSGNQEKIWHTLGTFEFLKGKKYSVSLNNESTQGYVVVDSLQVLALE